MRIAIVNDLPLALEVLRRIIREAGHQVAWTALDGQQALELCLADRPDLILMDLVMPVLDGVQATRLIREQAPCPILVVTATVAGHAPLVFEAMSHGALDAVNTPAVGVSGTLGGAAALLAKIDTIARLEGHAPPTSPQAQSAPVVGGLRLAAVGASTGGPGALTKMLGALPLHIAGAIVIVQHVDEQFAGGLARWLQTHTAVPIDLAVPGHAPQANHIYLAGSNSHLVIDDTGRFALEPPGDHAYSPSVDVFFFSLADRWRPPAVAPLLTGKGEDAAQGLLRLRERGWLTLAQDRESCVGWGRPRAAERLNAAAEVLPPEALGVRLVEYFRHKE